jgi:hypothetical protein
MTGPTMKRAVKAHNQIRDGRGCPLLDAGGGGGGVGPHAGQKTDRSLMRLAKEEWTTGRLGHFLEGGLGDHPRNSACLACNAAHNHETRPARPWQALVVCTVGVSRRRHDEWALHPQLGQGHHLGCQWTPCSGGGTKRSDLLRVETDCQKLVPGEAAVGSG